MMLKKTLTVLSLTAALGACSNHKDSSLNAFGTQIPTGQKPLRITNYFDNFTMRPRFDLLALGSGVTEARYLTIYTAVDMQGKSVQFLAYDGLALGTIVTDGSVFLLEDKPIGNGINSSTSPDPEFLGETILYSGYMDVLSKDGADLALIKTAWEDGSGLDRPQIIDFCSDQYVINRELLELAIEPKWKQLACDLNYVGTDLQITYNKINHVFKEPTILKAK